MIHIDVFTAMLGADSKPRAELFGPDELHLNREGYDLWKAVIGLHLSEAHIQRHRRNQTEAAQSAGKGNDR